MKESELPFSVGEKVQAAKMFSWTVEEFEDFPLVVEAGQTGTVEEILEKDERVYVNWDNDKFPERRKSLSFEETLTLKVVGEENKSS